MASRLPSAIALLAILAAACGGYDEGDFRSPTDPAGDFLTLETEGGATTLPADGISRLTLIARISPDAAPEDRGIVFTTTAGTLVAPGTDGQEVEITADARGEARLDLRADRESATAVVTARASRDPRVARSLQIRFVEAAPAAILDFIQAPATAPADGASASFFTVRLATAVPVDQRAVTFRATAGSFAPGSPLGQLTVTAATDFTATAVLYSPSTLTRGLVSAELLGFKREVAVDFVPAPAEGIALTLSAFTVRDTADDRLTVTAELRRATGTVTPGTRVTFEALAPDGARFGTFPEGAERFTDATARVQTTFSPAASGVRGTATLLVTAAGTPTPARATFQVVAP